MFNSDNTTSTTKDHKEVNQDNVTKINKHEKTPVNAELNQAEVESKDTIPDEKKPKSKLTITMMITYSLLGLASFVFLGITYLSFTINDPEIQSSNSVEATPPASVETIQDVNLTESDFISSNSAISTNEGSNANEDGLFIENNDNAFTSSQEAITDEITNQGDFQLTDSVTQIGEDDSLGKSDSQLSITDLNSPETNIISTEPFSAVGDKSSKKTSISPKEPQLDTEVLDSKIEQINKRISEIEREIKLISSESDNSYLITKLDSIDTKLDSFTAKMQNAEKNLSPRIVTVEPPKPKELAWITYMDDSGVAEVVADGKSVPLKVGELIIGRGTIKDINGSNGCITFVTGTKYAPQGGVCI